MKFKPGDLVKLKCGGPLMVVSYYSRPNESPWTVCHYFLDGNKRCEVSFVEDTLVSQNQEMITCAEHEARIEELKEEHEKQLDVQQQELQKEMEEGYEEAWQMIQDERERYNELVIRMHENNQEVARMENEGGSLHFASART